MTDIETKINEYTPNQTGMELLESGETVLIVGVTGAGKNTILHKMMQTGNYHDLVTTVTRAPRYNNGVLEQDGVDYHFISEQQALSLLDNGEYVEASLVHGRIYGVTAQEIARAHTKGKVALADVTVDGVAKYKKISDNVTAIFLVPPSYDEWKRRVKQRYPSDAHFLEDWPNRRTSAIEELEKALAAPYYHFVINDELDEAVKACLQIAERHDEFVRKDDEVRLMVRDMLDTIRKESAAEEQI